MKKKSKVTTQYRRLCEKLFDIKLKIKQIEDSAICICDECKTVIEEFDPSRLYKEENREIYDKWYCWYYLCDCGSKIYLKGDIRDFFRKRNITQHEWEEQYGKSNKEIKFY